MSLAIMSDLTLRVRMTVRRSRRKKRGEMDVGGQEEIEHG